MLTTIAATLSSTPQPELPGFLNSLASPLEHYGLWAIFVLVLVEDFGIPVPGETVLIAGAVLGGSGRMNIVGVGLVGFVAAVLGDNIGYAIGRFGGRALVERWGRYVFLTKERLDWAEDFFNRHGGKIITVARFVEGLRQANGLIAGVTQMHWLKFAAFNALGAALWVGTWVSVGYFAGQHITTIYTTITNYSLYAAIAAVVIIGAFIAFRIRKRRHERAAVAAHAVTEPTEPAEPTAPTVRAEATKPAESTSPTEATSPAEPTRPTQARAANGAAEQNRATAPNGATEPDEAGAQNGAGTPNGAAEPNGATAPNGATEPTEPKRPPGPGEPAKSPDRP